MKEKVLARFLRYVAIDTQSDEKNDTFPSTEKQWKLALLLKKELKEIGIKDVFVDDYAYVYASIPSNTTKKLPVVGFIAHMDTSPDMPGNDIKPKIIENYKGEDIVLNEKENIVLQVSEYQELKNYIGHSIVCTDGTTLLGADDKAGVAEIMTAVEYLLFHPEIKHGEIKIAFTPDEEIGRGTDYFEVEKFGADFAYTMDGSAAGEIEFENFNAASAKIYIQGNNIHPGYAKNRMLNAISLSAEFDSLLPAKERPEFTENYQGFYHLLKVKASVEKAEMQYIIRDHDRDKFELRKQNIEKAVAKINKKYGKMLLRAEIQDQYYNMREKIQEHMYVVDLAKKAIEEAGLKPLIQPIRGGTDGARLSYMGLPCPNIFEGGHNFHGKYEYVSVDVMVKAVEVILNIIKLVSKKMDK